MPLKSVDAAARPADERAALEMLQRAIRDGDQDAWNRVVRAYYYFVVGCIRRYGPLTYTEATDYWVNRAFERFWIAVKPERLVDFPTLGSLLRYLSLCAYSVVMDEARARARTQADSLSEDEDAPTTLCGGLDEFDAVHSDELWQAVAAALPDDDERLVAHLSWVRDLKPSQIQGLRPDRFASTNEVYRVKRAVIERLRRSEALQEFILA